MRHLYFCRHGESERNRLRIFAGQSETPLTDLGREQAKLAGENAKHLHFDLIVASPLSRARETAEIIAKATGYPIEKIVLNDMFRERSLGSLEGKSWDEYDEAAAQSDGAETEEQLLTRAKSGLEFLRTLPEENILLVGHGSFSRALRTAIDPHQTYDEPENAQVLRLL